MASLPISFAIDPPDHGDPIAVVPVVDGIRLTDRIHEFERAAKMETRASSYRGLIPAYYKFGPAEAHYVGRGGRHDKVVLLGCECGEWGCWPLLATVELTEATVTWQDFEQPYRKSRDYSGFGPFEFDRHEYLSALVLIADQWDAASPSRN